MRFENSTLLCIEWSQILYMSTLLTHGVSISNAFIAIYVEAVNTFSTQYTHM